MPDTQDPGESASSSGEPVPETDVSDREIETASKRAADWSFGRTMFVTFVARAGVPAFIGLLLAFLLDAPPPRGSRSRSSRPSVSSLRSSTGSKNSRPATNAGSRPSSSAGTSATSSTSTAEFRTSSDRSRRS